MSAVTTSVFVMNHDRLPDRWHTRDLPALLATASLLESEHPENADSQLDEFQKAAGMDERELVRALLALEQAGYIETHSTAPFCRGSDRVGDGPHRTWSPSHRLVARLERRG